MTTITLPRKLVEGALNALESWNSNEWKQQVAKELRAELDMYTKSTHAENVSKNEQKVYALGDVMDAERERERIKQNHLRSEYLTNKSKTDWSAS